MQEVQTLRRRGVRPSRMRIRWMLGFQRRGLRLWEKLTDMPKLGCLPQISQTAAMSSDPLAPQRARTAATVARDRKSTRLNSSHANISYAVFCLKKKKNT